MKPILMLPSIGALFFLSDHFDLRFDVVMVNRNIFQIWQNIATLVSSRYISGLQRRWLSHGNKYLYFGKVYLSIHVFSCHLGLVASEALKTPILASSIKIGNVDDSGDATYTIMSRDIILRDEVALVSDSTPKAFEVPAFLGFFQLTWVPSLGGW